jgi:hypothetical protein
VASPEPGETSPYTMSSIRTVSVVDLSEGDEVGTPGRRCKVGECRKSLISSLLYALHVVSPFQFAVHLYAEISTGGRGSDCDPW